MRFTSLQQLADDQAEQGRLRPRSGLLVRNSSFPVGALLHIADDDQQPMLLHRFVLRDIEEGRPYEVERVGIG
jgi:hypothetical protein